MKCHVRIEITHSKRGVMQGFTTNSDISNTLVVCYFYILLIMATGSVTTEPEL